MEVCKGPTSTSRPIFGIETLGVSVALWSNEGQDLNYIFHSPVNQSITTTCTSFSRHEGPPTKLIKPMKPANDNQPPRLWPKLLDAAMLLLGWLIFLAPVWFVVRGFL